MRISPEPADPAGPFVAERAPVLGVREDGCYPCDRVGVYIGAGLGGVTHIESTHTTLLNRGRGGCRPFRAADHRQHGSRRDLAAVGIQGPEPQPCLGVLKRCACHREAARTIMRGDADAMLAGGTEATVTPLGVGGFNAMRALSTRNDDPTRASRPFDRDRDGFVMGEGAGVLLLEERDSALRRGATIYAELVGYGLSADANHMTSPPADGEGRSAACAWRCVMLCGTASCRPISATSTRTAHPPSRAISPRPWPSRRSLGSRAAPGGVVDQVDDRAPLGAAGGAEASFCVLALQNGILPPTINLENPDPECDLDYVPNQARSTRLRVALSNSFGFGGTNVSLLFAAPT